MTHRNLAITVPVCLLALLGAACSGDPAATELDDVEAPVTDPEQIAAEHRRQLAGTLSEDERRTILDFLATKGIAEDSVKISGRMVGLEDGLHYADELLRMADPVAAVEKGRVFSSTTSANALPGCTAQFPCPERPVDLANQSGSNITWKRPDTTIKYYLVGPSNASSHFMLMLSLAGSRIAAAQEVGGDAADCLASSLFEAVTIAQYSALPLSTRQSTYVITFLHEADGQACFPGDRGCSTGPRMGSVKVGATTESRLRFGHIIGLLNTEPPTDEPDGVVNSNQQCTPGGSCSTSTAGRDEAVGVIIHEILHAMGLAHTNTSTFLAVPGTQEASGANQVNSVMVENPRASTSGFRNWNGLASPNNVPPLDRAMLRKLYRGSCTYSPNARTVTP